MRSPISSYGSYVFNTHNILKALDNPPQTQDFLPSVNLALVDILRSEA